MRVSTESDATMPLPIPAVVSRDATLAPLLEHLRDTLVPSARLSERWGYSEYYLANARRRGGPIPWIKLPGGRILYRMSDIMAAELGGVRGPVTTAQACEWLAAQTWLPAADRERLVAACRAHFG